MHFIKHYWQPIVFVLLIITAIFFIFFEKPSKDIHLQSAKKIEQYISKQKIVSQEIIQKFSTDTTEKQLINKALNLEKKIINNYLHLAIYKNDTAIFWTTNDFIPYSINKNILKSNVVFINNTWAYILKKNVKSFTVVVFIPIKKEYPFENKYLQNFYYGSLNLQYDYTFSFLPEPTSYFVSDNTDTFFLSINPRSYIYSELHSVLFIIILFLMYALLHFCLFKINKTHFFLHSFLLSLIALVALRFAMQYFKIPDFLYATKLFSVETYTSGSFLFSLGDVLFNSWLLLIITEFYLIKYNRKIVKKTYLQYFTLLLWGFVTWFWLYVWNSLVFESKILFDIYNSSSFSFVSIIAFLIIGFYAWIFARYSFFLIQFLKKFGPKKHLLYLSLLTVGLFVAAYFSKISFHWSIAFLLLSLIVLWYQKNKHFLYYLLNIVILTSFISLYTLHLYSKKSYSLHQVVAYSLANEKDYVAQMLLLDIEKHLTKDRILQSMLNKAYDNRYEIYQYLKDNYFYGFWNKYDLQITICNNFDNLRLMPSGQIVRCFDYFNKIIASKGSIFGCKQFFSISSEYGEISFLGKFSFPHFIASDTSEKSIFLELTSKPISNTPGYPDLLMDLKTFQSLNTQWQNYAKYQNNKLIQQKGDYTYSSVLNFKKPAVGNFLVEYDNKYQHFIYTPNSKTTIVVSSKKVLWHDYLIMMLYLFNIYISIFGILYGIYYALKNKPLFTYGFRFKYISTFIVVLISSYVLIALYTLIFFQKRYEQKNKDQLLFKTQTMINHLHEQIGNWNKLFSIPKNELIRFLITTSNVFYCDVHIFTNKGELYATSRPAFFDKGLKSKLIEFDVIQQIVQNNKLQLIKDESVGNFVYLESYTALIENNKLLGILQFPYFTEKEKSEQEILAVLINLFNIYLLFIFLSFVIVYLIANGILKPITYLQLYFKKIQTSKHIQPIVYNQRDEILPLVNEYNRMLEELARSTEKLLQSERESTWREVARQIAHEIKNPLTPMKLNIQYLLKQKKEKGYIPDEMLKNTMRILLEQIDSLASIASAFSTFAKMPSPQLEETELIDEIKKAIHLFTNSDFEIRFNSNKIKHCYIVGDKEYIQRILNNVLTNAIQAIPQERQKDISVSVQNTDKNIIIAIKDNGIGINSETAQNIFKPSFTTKSSGMGMGLALVKNMTETMNGKIYFDTQINVGTTFYFEFPYLKIEFYE